MSDSVLYEVNNGVGVITLNRPDSRNALNFDMRCGLVEVWKEAEADRSSSVIVLTGAGKTFSGGHDLKEQLTPAQKAIDPGSPPIYSGLRNLTKPAIAAINGPCLAQGAALALLCDIRIASTTSVFGWPQVTRGLSSVSGPTLFARYVPWNIAMEYLLTGKMLPPAEALRWGIINNVVEPDDLMKVVLEIAETIAGNAPLAVKAVKEAARLTASLDPDEAFQVAWLIRERVYQTEDAKEGRRSFAEKRAPVWQGQ